MATIEDFNKLDVRIGTIVKADLFKEARVPAIKLEIDFGELGIKTSSAQITKRYAAEEIVGKQVVAIVNFPPRRIAGFNSEVLVLGGVPEKDDVVLLQPDQRVPNGTAIS
ncbi:chaperone CsaA [Paenibacillus lentus]|uniref:chaperone CsaA n=1 Tax=Paenibacillus lentus TaxID=1338368 RepID=UPI0036519A56